MEVIIGISPKKISCCWVALVWRFVSLTVAQRGASKVTPFSIACLGENLGRPTRLLKNSNSKTFPVKSLMGLSSSSDSRMPSSRNCL